MGLPGYFAQHSLSLLNGLLYYQPLKMQGTKVFLAAYLVFSRACSRAWRGTMGGLVWRIWSSTYKLTLYTQTHWNIGDFPKNRRWAPLPQNWKSPFGLLSWGPKVYYRTDPNFDAMKPKILHICIKLNQPNYATTKQSTTILANHYWSN